jgi:hypothetical protein
MIDRRSEERPRTLMIVAPGRHRHGRTFSFLQSLLSSDCVVTLAILETSGFSRRDAFDYVIMDEYCDRAPLAKAERYQHKPDWKLKVYERQGQQNAGAPSNLLMQMMGRIDE